MEEETILKRQELFKAKVSIKYSLSQLFPKDAISTMFPKNWSLDRIKEEVAFVYENTVVKGLNKKVRFPDDIFDKYEGETLLGFRIRIEVDELGNIANAFPIIN